MDLNWLSPAQCVGYLAFVLGVASFLQTDDRRFKLFMAAEWAWRWRTGPVTGYR